MGKKKKIPVKKAKPKSRPKLASGKKKAKKPLKKATHKKPIKKKVKTVVKPVKKLKLTLKAKQAIKPVIKTVSKPTKTIPPVNPKAISGGGPKPTPPVPPTGKAALRKPATLPPLPTTPPVPVKKIITIVRSETDKKKPDPPGKYTLEYIIHSPLSIIFEMISSPSGLCEWFADDVHVKEGGFVFFWDGVPQDAKMVNYKDDRLVRFQWDGKGDGKYFEFRLQVDELTNEVSLFVTDFMEEGSDLASAKLLWDKQISNLKHVLGS